MVALALWPDVDRLVEPGIVADDWDENEHDGIVHNSVVVLAVRPGNPKGITGWDDLVRDDVDVITPNPFTSGGAQWNLLAAYQAQIEAGKSPEEAIEYLKQLIANVSVMDKGARDALTTFMAGQGDVLIAYENEAIFAQQAGQPSSTWCRTPPSSSRTRSRRPSTVMRPRHPGPSWTSCTRRRRRRVFGEHGFRPEDETVAAEFDFYQPPKLFTIEALGGWAEARPKFFDPEDGQSWPGSSPRSAGMPAEAR